MNDHILKMLSTNKNNFFTIVCLLSVLPALCQHTLQDVEGSFHEYEKYSASEKIFAHTDKDLYLAGEIAWFKLYVVDADNNKPMDVSKLAYVEILNNEQKPVLQAKLSLDSGMGSGSLYLPATLNSGLYTVRAYTNWMKNFSPDFYFEKPITIINSLRSPNVPAVPARRYDIQFFPEGGYMVDELPGKIAFKIVDQSGKGMDCKGFIVSSTNDTVTAFAPLRFGIGKFNLTPKTGITYKAIVNVNDTLIVRELPKPLAQGYVLNVSAENRSQLRIRVSTNITSANVVYLFVHTRASSKMNEKGILTNGAAEFIIDRNKLGEGVSHFTVFTSELKPVCERLFFTPPTEKLIIQPSIQEQQLSSRKNVHIAVSSMDESKKSLPAEMSLSVYRVDSLQQGPTENIENYLWLRSDLKGTIESPDYYFSGKNAEVEEAVDNLMLTHGWRKFSWQEILQHKKPLYDFIPEYQGHIIYGKIKSKSTGLPSANSLAYLSIPGSSAQLYVSRSDSSGGVRFYTKDLYGPNEIVLQTENRDDTIDKSEVRNGFSDKFSSQSLPGFSLSKNLKDILSDYHVSVQVQNNFNGEKLKRFYAPAIDTVSFFGSPDQEYLLDNYTRFSTMEEVLREYVLEVLVRRQRENFHFIVADPDNKIFLNDPLTLLNGVPVFDPNKIVQYDPLKVKKIDIIKRKYFYGPLIANGIVNFITYQPDPAILSDLNSVVLEYEGLQYDREFYSPVYETQEQISSRQPDFRNVLYWSPRIQTNAEGKADVNFFTSDLKGKYIVVFQGMNGDGRAGEASISFEVN